MPGSISSMPMPVIHFSVKPVHASPTKGAASLLGLIGYISGERSFGGAKVHNPHAPSEVAYFDALGIEAARTLELVQRVNLAEMRRDGSGYQMRGGRRTERKLPDGTTLPPKPSQGPTLARHIDTALPWGAPPNARLEIAQRFARHLRTEFGCAVFYGVHNKSDAACNDAHFLITDREVDEAGRVGKKIRGLNNFATTAKARASGEIGQGEVGGSCEKLRAKFAEICNEALATHGAETVTHKSYERQGLQLTPQKKRNRAAELKAARIAAREIIHAPHPALTAHASRSIRNLRKTRLRAEQERQSALARQATNREMDLAQIRAAARAVAERNTIAAIAMVATEILPEDLRAVGVVTPGERPNFVPGSSAPAEPDGNRKHAPEGARIVANAPNSRATTAIDFDTPSRHAPTTSPPISAKNKPSSIETPHQNLIREALDAVSYDLSDDDALLDLHNNQSGRDLSVDSVDPMVAANADQRRAPPFYELDDDSIDPMDDDTLTALYGDRQTVRHADAAPTKKGNKAKLDRHRPAPSETDGNGPQPAWHPSMASDVEKRLIRVLIDRRFISAEWYRAVCQALGELRHRFDTWWKSATSAARAEILDWAKPTFRELCADLVAKGVTPPPGGVESTRPAPSAPKESTIER